MGRACFDRAEFSRDTAERANLDEGIAACEKVIARQPKLAAGHYYLAMNLAQLARTKLLGALPILGRMESGWLTARRLDEKFDYAGPDRFVGLFTGMPPAGLLAWAITKKRVGIWRRPSSFARIFRRII